jgi:ubiquinone/menaquinone biosynthesis C-methylase UbiE
MVYDNLMDHVNYQMWAEYILKIITMHCPQVRSVIDLACGTGNLLKNLNQPDWIMFGCDISPDMIRIFRNKLNTQSIRTLVANILHIPIKDQKFDAILLMYDSINYLSTKKSLHHALTEISRVLKTGGLFIFDTVTPEHCQTYFNGEIEEHFANDLGYSRKSRYDAINQLQSNEFIIYTPNKQFYEHHIQRIYSSMELQKYMTTTNFELIGMFNDFTFEKPSINSERIHFVCRKL